jgi:hypothetical protein
LRRRRDACESSVRVRPSERKPGERDGGLAHQHGTRREISRDDAGAADFVRRRCRPPQHRTDPRQQLLVCERPHEKVVAAALERPDTVDCVRLRLPQDDHGHVAVTCPVLVDGGAVGKQDEIGPGGFVDDLEAVAPQMALEKRLRLRQQQRGRHTAKLAPAWARN